MKFVLVLALFGACLALPNATRDLSKLTPKNVFVNPTGPAPAHTKIIGGTVAGRNSKPYQVGLIIDGSGFCGGSLISSTYVLTAGHCTSGARSIEVILGAHNIQQVESTQVSIKSKTIITHSGYNANTITNDIGLIQLASAAPINSVIQTISLAPASSGSFSGTTALLTGWGKTSNSGSIASELRQVNLPVITNSVCTNSFGSSIKSTMVCTSGAGPKGGCNGDSGGPLVVDGQQIGIVSFGSSDCLAGYPTVFTRVSEYRSWISQNANV